MMYKYSPDSDTFCAKAEAGLLVPVFREIAADLETPVSAFLKLHADRPAFLLESVINGERIGRYSFIGCAPRRILTARDGLATLQENGSQTAIQLDGKDALHLLERLLAKLEGAAGASDHNAARARQRDYTSPLIGAVGYLSYDMVRFFERLPVAPYDELLLPDCVFLLVDTLVVFDHARHTLRLVAVPDITHGAQRAYAEAEAKLDALAAALEGPIPPMAGGRVATYESELTSNFTAEEFCRQVEIAKEYIAAGDAFQIVLSQRLRRRTSADGFAIYRALRRLNPSPYMFYLDFGSFELIGSSPEVLVKLQDGRACIRPLAGTRRRGASAAEDDALIAELLADEKERAEHVMLVDLARNDLGRVCRSGSVRVPILMDIEKYSHVIHIVSEVEGELEPGKSAFDLLRAAFPAGTVSGAPKIRAMEIIAELEGLRRGPYAGAVGYFGLDGNMDTCIAIRTIVKVGDTIYLQAGAGIVADSDPWREYQETINKLRALEEAVKAAEGRAGETLVRAVADKDVGCQRSTLRQVER